MYIATDIVIPVAIQATAVFIFSQPFYLFAFNKAAIQKPITAPINNEIIMTEIVSLLSLKITASSNKANIGTPTEHDLPFTSSYTSGGADGAANSYYKSDNNLIIIAFSVCRKDGEPFTSVDTIAIIPEGYRPRNIVSASCPYGSISKTGSSAPTPIGQASVYLTMSGLVRIRTTEMDARCVFGTLIYYIH